MSSETIYHRYRLKRRTTAGWAANNEVLLTGEPGIEVLVDGTEKIKYGDGVKTWSQLNYAAGGGAALSNATPQALGTAAAGTSAEGSRADHRHQMPNAAQVGADASGTAAAAVAAHAAAADPHPDYVLESDLRMSNPRTPTAHKSTHATGGADALSPTDIGAATAAQGAKADTAIQPGNAALSDAREWSAETISQAEAEAGTATIRRAFTAARVFQAVAAWWAGSAAKTKLDGIASGATANSPDAQLRDRTTHTGTQPASTITGLSNVATSGVYNDLSGKPDLSVKADLVNGLIPSSQLPGFVDDVVEFANLAAFPATGEAGKLYIALNTNKQYRWAGSSYQEINPSPGSTDAVPEGSVNLYHTTARAAAAAPVQSVAGRTGNVTLAKSDVGLSSVDNTSDANKPISTATAAALAGKIDTTDSRLSDARTPTAHNQAWSTITGTPTTLGGYGITDAFNPATPGAIGGTTPAAGTFSALLATTRLGLPLGAPASPAARDLYQVADTLRYRDSAGNERLLLNATDNLANLSSAATARTNLSTVGTVTTGITGAAQITNIVSISQANYDAIATKDSQTLYVISG